MTLRERRLAAGLRQDDVAKKLRVDQTTVSCWECGIRTPRQRSAQKLAKLYGCTVEEILAEAKRE